MVGSVRFGSIWFGEAGRVWRGWWGEVRFNLAGQVGRYGVRRGVVLFGRLGGVGFGSLP